MHFLKRNGAREKERDQRVTDNEGGESTPHLPQIKAQVVDAIWENRMPNDSRPASTIESEGAAPESIKSKNQSGLRTQNRSTSRMSKLAPLVPHQSEYPTP